MGIDAAISVILVQDEVESLLVHSLCGLGFLGLLDFLGFLDALLKDSIIKLC